MTRAAVGPSSKENVASTSNSSNTTAAAMSNNNTVPSSRFGKKTLSDAELEKLTSKLAHATKLGGGGAPSNMTARPPVMTSTPVTNAATARMTPGSSNTILKDDGSLSMSIMPLGVQEQALIQDLLYVLLGMDGRYIRKIPSYMSTLLSLKSLDQQLYTIDTALDPSLVALAGRFLPLATCYAYVSHVAEEAMAFHHGYVVHAMAAQTRHFLHDYHLFVAHLETQSLYGPAGAQPVGLQQWWSWSVDVDRTMRVLAEMWHAVVWHAGNPTGDAGKWQRGGYALNVLHHYMTMNGGDSISRDVVKSVLDKAVLPYVRTLETWTTRGEIHDPYDEFMVLEKSTVRKEDLNAEYNDAYWETRYRVRGDTRGTDIPATSLEELRAAFHAPASDAEGARDREAVPFFLKSMEETVLLCGKYLNVIRECGRSVGRPVVLAAPAPSALTAGNPMTRVVERVHAAYKSANAAVLKLLFEEHHLVARLRSVKHYFFLDQSDFMVHFLDAAYTELRKPARELSLAKLQSLLDLVLRNSSSNSAASTDPYKEDVRVDMCSMGLMEQLLRIIGVTGALEEEAQEQKQFEADLRGKMAEEAFMMEGGSGSGVASGKSSSGRILTGLNAFMLDYKVPFPVSLVISRKALTRYQIIFRHIFMCKYVERLLTIAWSDHQSGYKKYVQWLRNPDNHAVDDPDALRSACADFEQTMNRAYNLRAQMLLFAQNLIYYVFNEVLEPHWADLERHLARAETVDEVLKHHADFLDTCLKECMLTNKGLLMCQMQLLNVCASFATQTDRFMRNFFISPASILTDATRVSLNTYARIVDKAAEIFDGELLKLMDAVHYMSAIDGDHRMPHLAARLDFSGFYASAFGRGLAEEVAGNAK